MFSQGKLAVSAIVLSVASIVAQTSGSSLGSCSGASSSCVARDKDAISTVVGHSALQRRIVQTTESNDLSSDLDEETFLTGAETSVGREKGTGDKSSAVDPKAINMFNLRVDSAGGNDGNICRFYVNGKQLPVRCGRGITVVELKPDFTVQATRSFDTYGSEANSAKLVAYINGMSAGSLVMMSVLDEASHKLTAAAKSAISSNFGASSISSLKSRDSWALISNKGARSAVAEQLKKTHSGKASVSVTVAETWPIAGP
eukprot:TRINITY_DN2082_c0_g1_i2.p1 TRINITY_DN2082_c0_g1~~TRINITY_DN2082_c0_g1_i2.p1  ORF type:complete len:258 (-),score=42.80 TRINITY_DN2082_c0_g1_i2:334-1107(-)